ncbi:MAG: LuxR C-terminal-related transcriptional regulator [Muribaculaceae bacterium]|nr:LuxR C-terminal-related transcriptional regulator [Muribaculaceae bacterium]
MTETHIEAPLFFDSFDRMRDIVFSNNEVLPALSRFRIPLGFGESMVADVCKDHGVDVPTFLAVINFISSKPYKAFNVNLPTLIKYLKSAHEYFLEYVMPGIRSKLIAAISTGTPDDYTFLFVRHLDKFIAEVRHHLAYEEEKVFPYVEKLLAGQADEKFSIKDFEDSHQPIVGKLAELKELFIGHFTARAGRVDMLNSVLYDLITLEKDLTAHCKMEDSLFVPAVIKLEMKVEDDLEEIRTSQENNIHNDELDEHGDIILTPREREIVHDIALGMSNKEIAEKLFLSIHTVTTHRRNISTKLNLHSSSSITLYAVMHGIISLDEIK